MQRSTRSMEGGFSLLEVLVATIILSVLGVAVVSIGLKSRTQIDYEEVRRRAIALAQERLETVRGSFEFAAISAAVIDTTITLDGTTYTLRSWVADGIDPANDDSLDQYMKTVADTVRWTATSGGQTATRRVTMSTVIFRGLS